MAGRSTKRPAKWGRCERRAGGIQISNPGHLMGAGEWGRVVGREGGVGACWRVAREGRRRWERRLQHGRRRRPEVVGGPDKWAPPVGDPGRERRGHVGCGLGLGPAQQGARAEGKWADGPTRGKKREKGEKEKERISRGLFNACA